MSEDRAGSALDELFRGRRSVRTFSPEPVPEATILELLDLAITAPSASNKQPWRFLVVTSPSTIRAMADAVREARARILDATPEASRPSIAAYGDYFTRFEGAPCVVVPIHRPLTILSSLTEGHLPADDHAAIARMEAESGLVGVSLAVMQLLLAAHARGLGASGMTGPLIARARIAEILGVPAGWDIALLVPLGYPAETPAPTERKSAERVTRFLR